MQVPLWLPGRTRWCPRGGRDAHAAHLEQVALRQQVQRGIKRRQAVAPRAALTHDLHRAGGRFRMTVVHARLRALDTAGVPGRTGSLSRAALVVMFLQELAYQLLAPPVQSRSSSLWLICRASLEERKALASAKTASADGPGRSMRRTPVRGSCTSTVRPWNPVVTAIAGLPSQGTVPERRANVQKGARMEEDQRVPSACSGRAAARERRTEPSPNAVTPQNALTRECPRA